MTPIAFELPWPPASLHPNGRAHHMVKARAANKAKRDAYLVALSASRGVQLSTGRLRVHMEFRPTTRRGRDKDNSLASCKAQLDGIASALGVNDSRFDPVVEFAEPKRARVPSVMVTITEAA
jgi:crossover junction endodeoxyribonuclease RusA